MSDTPVKPFQRPLSPHLQVYRLPMTAIMSITHRITGAILAGGCLLITAFLVAAAMGQNYYDKITSLTHTLLGALVMFAWSLVLFYHMCNGVRHLIWDSGAMFEKRQAEISGWVVLLAAVILNTITWYFAKA